jgi:hypothetical protein
MRMRSKWPGCIDMLIFPDDDKLLYVDADAFQFGCGAIMFQYDAAGTETLPLRFMAHVFITAAHCGHQVGAPLRRNVMR